MKEPNFDDSTYDNNEISKSTIMESNILDTHEKKIDEMLKKSQNIVTQIKKLSQ